jgi:signal transduction histidine kinase
MPDPHREPPDATAPTAATNPIERNEERMATAMAYVRVGMVPLMFVPLLGRSRRLGVAALVALGATAEAAWAMRRVRTVRRLDDRVLVWGDALSCVALSMAAARIDPDDRRRVMNSVVSFGLVGAGFAGFGFGPSVEGGAVVGVLAGSWTVAVLPDANIKLVSDLLGFLLWYCTTIVAGREFRQMARQVTRAQEDALHAQEETAERDREADVAREREITHREIHEHLLPIVDAVASRAQVGDGLVRLAAREADRARRLLMDGRLDVRPGFEALVADVRDTYVDAGVALTAILRIVSEPPSEVADALAGAAREALSNAVKYAGLDQPVTFYAESTERGVEIVVRDRGRGFDTVSVVAGGGFGRTYEAVRRRGGEVEVTSAPGHGTKVVIRWSPPAAPTST